MEEEYQKRSIKLRIKLKLPANSNNSKEEREEKKNIPIIEEEEEEEYARICHICNKRFSSGKALGGHMRIHSQSSSNQHPDKSNLKTAGMETKNPNCAICFKNFPSMKSLFGHMRCHPNRDYRGIRPPTNSPSSTLSDEKIEQIEGPVDLSQLNWSLTNKRGRKSLIGSGSGSGSNSGNASQLDTQIDNAAAIELMMLAQGSTLNNCATSPMKRLKVGPSAFEAEVGIDENNDRTMKKQKKKRRLSDLEEQANLSNKYKCTICNKSFLTHQALGGHMASHSKNKSSDVFGYANSNEEIASSHHCSVCNNDFPTGQALGGHKRLHYTSPAEAPSIGESSQTYNKKGFNFDLNELPAAEEDGECTVNNRNVDACSSSYNSIISQQGNSSM